MVWRVEGGGWSAEGKCEAVEEGGWKAREHGQGTRTETRTRTRAHELNDSTGRNGEAKRGSEWWGPAGPTPGTGCHCDWDHPPMARSRYYSYST